MTAIWLFVSLLAVFTIRILPLALWGRPGLTTGDVISHLTLIDAIRQQRDAIPDLSPKFLLSDSESYPIFYHQVLSLLPAKLVDLLEPAIGSIVETLHAGIVFGTAYFFASRLWGVAHPEQIAAAASLLFAITPLLVENPGRVYRMSPRPLSAMLTGTSMLTLVVYLSTGTTAWLFVSAAVAGLVGLTSKFGVQAILFLTSFLAIFSWDFRPLQLPLLGFICAFIFSRGHYLTVLYGHLHHSAFYCTYLKDKIHYTTSFTYSQIWRWPLTLVRQPREALRLLVTHFLLVGFTFVPAVALLAATYIARPEWIFGEGERWLALWYLSGVATMFLTATPWFRFLGEAFRYVEYSVPAICLLTAVRTFAVNSPVIWEVAAAVSSASVVGVLGSYYVAKLVTRHDAERAALYDWIRTQPASTLLTIDLRLSFLLCFRTPHRAVQANNNAPTGEKLEAYKRLVSRWYPLPDTNLNALIDEYDVDLLVVCDKTVAAIQAKDPGYVYDLSGYEEVFRQGRFRVLKPHKTGAQLVAA